MIPQNISLCIPFLCGLIVISFAAGLGGAQQSVAAAPASTGFIDVDGGKLCAVKRAPDPVGGRYPTREALLHPEAVEA